MLTTKPMVLRADPAVADNSVVAAVVDALTEGGLAIFPTDTVYGIACRADDDEAVRSLFAAKKRPLDKPLPLLLGDAGGLDRVAGMIDDTMIRLAQRFWPGPLTMVICKSPDVLDVVTGGQPTVGVRVPDMTLTQAILQGCPFAVAVTSANFSEEDPACGIENLPEALLSQVMVVVDGGMCPGMLPSTVVDVTDYPPRVLRQGPISVEQILSEMGPPTDPEDA
jgi:L-threonylcarbamoyladenylate synthase